MKTVFFIYLVTVLLGLPMTLYTQFTKELKLFDHVYLAVGYLLLTVNVVAFYSFTFKKEVVSKIVWRIIFILIAYNALDILVALIVPTKDGVFSILNLNKLSSALFFPPEILWISFVFQLFFLFIIYKLAFKKRVENQ